MFQNKGEFKLFNVEHSIDFSHYRCTIDHDEDFIFAGRIIRYLEDKENFRMKDILQVIEDHPEITQINAGFVRNEGYLKSINQEEQGEIK